MLKKRFRILRLPMLVKDMAEVEDIVKVCCVLHNMCLQVHACAHISTHHTHTYACAYMHVSIQICMHVLISMYEYKHNQERGWDSIDVMDNDWQDKGPDACRARREICVKA